MTLRGDVEKMVDYMWSEEQQHHEEYMAEHEARGTTPKEHIFDIMKRVRHNLEEIPL